MSKKKHKRVSHLPQRLSRIMSQVSSIGGKDTTERKVNGEKDKRGERSAFGVTRVTTTQEVMKGIRFPEARETAVIFKSELDFISRCILDCPSTETGGQLFGYYTSDGIPVVLYAIGPGRHANHQTTFFNQDIDYLKRMGPD